VNRRIVFEHPNGLRQIVGRQSDLAPEGALPDRTDDAVLVKCTTRFALYRPTPRVTSKAVSQ
jgi:hypothetical protein